jgi:hypothetical protein
MDKVLRFAEKLPPGMVSTELSPMRFKGLWRD